MVVRLFGCEYLLAVSDTRTLYDGPGGRWRHEHVSNLLPERCVICENEFCTLNKLLRHCIASLIICIIYDSNGLFYKVPSVGIISIRFLNKVAPFHHFRIGRKHLIVHL